MITFRTAAIAAIILAASAGFAVAQTDEGQDAHHDAQAAAQGTPASQVGLPAQDEDEDQAGTFGPGFMGPGMMGGGAYGPGFMGPGMMGQGMMGQGWAGRGGTAPMMQMMQGMTQMMQGMTQMMQGAGQPGARFGMMPGAMMEARIAAMKTELGITDAQLPQWNAFVDAMRSRDDGDAGDAPADDAAARSRELARPAGPARTATVGASGGDEGDGGADAGAVGRAVGRAAAQGGDADARPDGHDGQGRLGLMGGM